MIIRIYGVRKIDKWKPILNDPLSILPWPPHIIFLSISIIEKISKTMKSNINFLQDRVSWFIECTSKLNMFKEYMLKFDENYQQYISKDTKKNIASLHIICRIQ